MRRAMQNAPLFLCLYIKKRVKRAKISGQTFLTIPWILRQSDILKKLYVTKVFHFCLSSWFRGCNEHLKGFNSINGNKKSLIRQGCSNLMLLYGTSVGSTWGHGFIAAMSIARAGYFACALTRTTLTKPSSSGWRIASSAAR